MSKKIEGKYMGSVKVGQKGQIVIPKEVRKMFDIEPGDSLVLLGDKDRGIAINTFDFYSKLADEIFKSRGSVEEEEMTFAKMVNDLKKD